MSRRDNASPSPLPAGMPQSILDLARHFQFLPGVGEKTAQKFALALATGDAARAEGLAHAIRLTLATVRTCGTCGGLCDDQGHGWTGIPVCYICADSKRDAGLLCVVGRQVDLMAVERSGAMRGRYFVLGRLLSPLEGVDLADLPVARLRQRIEAGVVEVLLALPSSVEGAATTFALERELRAAAPAMRVTRIAQGVSAGADLEYADALTLSAAIAGRAEVQVSR